MIRDKVQTKLAAAFNGKLSDAVRPFTGVRETGSSYDPSTGQTVTNTFEYKGRGVFGGYDNSEIDGERIQTNDRRLSGVLANELLALDDQGQITETMAEPAVGDVIDGFRVESVSQDPAKAAWTLQLRANQ